MIRVYCSNGSPFARKVRIALHEMGLNFEEDVYDAVRPVDHISQLTPTLQVPVIDIDGRRLYGSNLILRYLFESFASRSNQDPPFAPSICRPKQRWDDELIVETIETMAGSLIGVRLHQGADPMIVPYIQRQLTRVDTCLDWLEERITQEGFWPGYFSVMDMNLMCPLLYGERRKVFDYRSGRWPKIAAVIDRWADRPSVMATPLNDLPQAS